MPPGTSLVLRGIGTLAKRTAIGVVGATPIGRTAIAIATAAQTLGRHVPGVGGGGGTIKGGGGGPPSLPGLPGGGSTGLPATGGSGPLAPGSHISRGRVYAPGQAVHGHYTKKGTWTPRRRPRMNVANIHALRKSVRRLKGAEKMFRRVLSVTSSKKPGKVHPKFKKRST